MVDKINNTKFEKLKGIIISLNLRSIELQCILDEINRELGYDQKFDRPDRFEVRPSEFIVPEKHESAENPVVFEKFDDGTSTGLTLPLLIGSDADGKPVYF
jgi:superfamily I DNA and/or RNA helicase